jgi:hypothetical protein
LIIILIEDYKNMSLYIMRAYFIHTAELIKFQRTYIYWHEMVFNFNKKANSSSMLLYIWGNVFYACKIQVHSPTNIYIYGT